MRLKTTQCMLLHPELNEIYEGERGISDQVPLLLLFSKSLESYRIITFILLMLTFFIIDFNVS